MSLIKYFQSATELSQMVTIYSVIIKLCSDTKRPVKEIEDPI
jgi:hypothetical protein